MGKCLARILTGILFGVSLVLPILTPLGRSTAAAAGGNSRFGVDFVSAPGTVADTQRFSQATGLGIGWDRFPFYWSSLQPTRGGPIDFSQSDAVVNADVAHGLNIDGILVGAPSWATTNGEIDLDAWSSFVSQVVTHYKGQIHAWEMWNEPDLLNAQGQGQYWTWGVPAYYQLLKYGYLAAKAADPSVTVILGGLSFPYNDQDFFPQLVDQIAADPTAAANHGYFDVLAFHSYDRVARMYELPLGYNGAPSFAGFRPLLQKIGLNPPIWVNELGVPIWDYGTGQEAPGRATQSEQANYLVESIADGMAAGVDKFFAFQLYDDGAGAVDPRSGSPAEYFGLVANDGTPRPALTTYQNTINLSSGVQAATHLTERRGAKFQNHKGVEIVTLYGTNSGRVTIAWNDDPGPPVSVGIPTGQTSAALLDPYGHTIGQMPASSGVYTVTLPGATNNNNFDCYTPNGCNPNDYIIGGTPVILVENDPNVPAVVFNPLRFDSVAPIAVSWHPTGALPSGATYDVQYRDAVDGVWHDWLSGTSQTSALFGDGGMQLQSGDTYEFRIRAHDANGNLIGGDYSNRALAATVVIGGNVLKPGASTDAKIEIVWPHGSLPVSQTTQVNVGADLFQHGSTVSASPSYTGTVQLWRSLNNGVEELVKTGTERLASAVTFNYPVWDFNDVDVSAARDPQNKYYFRVGVAGQNVNSTIWSHGADARTYFPKQDTPTGVLSTDPITVDAKIEIVWPHGNAPVAQANLANLGVDLFGHGTLQSVPITYTKTVRLYAAINNSPLQLVAVGDRVPQTQNGLTYPTWQFNNVDVSAAKDPNNRIYFRVEVVGATSYSNVWTHGVDARTYFPKQDVPSGVAP